MSDLPTNRDAAEAVLGAMLLSAEAVDEVAAMLPGRAFYDPRHELIYDAILRVIGSSTAVDAITVADALTASGELARAGGAAYLHELAAATPTPSTATFYARIVLDEHRKREAAMALTRAQQGLADGAGLETVLGAIQSSVDDLRRDSADAGPTRLVEYLEPTAELLTSGTRGMTTGLRDLDEVIGGLAPGQLVVVGARPATGKTVVALEIARANARAGTPVLFFSFEMSGEEMMCRVLSAECSIPSDRMSRTHPSLTEADWAKIAAMPDILGSWDFFLDTGGDATVESVVATIRQYQRTYPGLLVVVDYLQLMSTARRHNGRQEQVTDMSRQMKLAAMELSVPIVLLSQLNRASESRVDKRPVMADLRDSGSVEQDADVVILLHREDVYDRESSRAGEIDLIVAKQRGGATKTVAAAAQLHYMRVRDMARDYGNDNYGHDNGGEGL